MKSVSDVVRSTSSALEPFATNELIKRVRFKMMSEYDSSIKDSIDRALGRAWPEFNVWDVRTWNPWDGPQIINELIDDYEFDQMDEQLEGLGDYGDEECDQPSLLEVEVKSI